MDDKCCSKCGILKPLSEFHKDKTKASGRKSHCKACSTEYQREYQEHYRRTSNGRDYQREYRRRHPEKYRAKTPQIANAYKAVHYAVTTGKLAPIENVQCTYCPEQAEHYHHDDYSKPLEVVPFCRKCHKKVHRLSH